MAPHVPLTGIVVSKTTKQVRRIVTVGHPGNSHHLSDGRHVGSKEEMIIPPDPITDMSLPAIEALVEQITGVKPAPTASALVDKTNTVVEIKHIDSDVEGHPVHKVIGAYSPQVAPGCTYDPSSGLFSTPEISYPPGTYQMDRDPVTGEPIAWNTETVTIPARVIPKP